MKNKETRRAEAKERQADYDTLTPQQKLLKLDIKLGGGKGAVKERAKLAVKAEERPGETKSVKTDKKPYQKPKKS